MNKMMALYLMPPISQLSFTIIVELLTRVFDGNGLVVMVAVTVIKQKLRSIQMIYDQCDLYFGRGKLKNLYNMLTIR